MNDNDLFTSMVNWKRLYHPSFNCSAIYVCDFSKKPFPAHVIDGKVEAIVFSGSHRGTVARWYILEEKAQVVSFQFGHNSKIVQFDRCSYPDIKKAVVSLSHDGTICIWGIYDGYCHAKFERICPEGCQRIAVSRTYVEKAVISGSFSHLYIVNIQSGQVLTKIRPSNQFYTCLTIYPASTEWLMTVNSKGCAHYTCLANNQPYSQAVLLYSSRDSIVLNAFPSPSFRFLLLILSDGYAVISLTTPGFPAFTDHEMTSIGSAVWTSEDNYVIVKMNGSLFSYQVFDPSPMNTHESVLIKTFSQHEGSETNLSFIHSHKFLSNPAFLAPLADDEIDENEESYNDLKPPIRSSSNESMDRIILDQPELIYDVNSNSGMYMPALAAFKESILLGDHENLIVGCQDFQEYQLKSSFKPRNHPITAQDYLVVGNEIIAVVEGSLQGKISIRFVKFGDDKKPKKQRTKVHHKGKVTALCVTDHYLVSAGEDCLLYIFRLMDFELVAKHYHFTAPVDQILRVSRNTDTLIDDMIFCVTRNNVISMISLIDHESKRILSGHDANIKHLWYHPFTELLLVDCTSLYLWSLASGNLETIMAGHQKEQFLKDSLQFLVEIKPPLRKHSHFMIKPLRFGGLSLNIIMIDIHFLAKEIANVLVSNPNIPINEALSLIPNFPLVVELISERTLRHFHELGSHLNSLSFTMGTVGASRVLSIWSPTIRFSGKQLWQVSSLISATILAQRAMLSFAMKVHHLFSQNYISLFNIDPSTLTSAVHDFHPPSLIHLFRFLLMCSAEIHNYVLDVLKRYPESTRLEWSKRLQESFRLFPHLRTTYGLVSAAISTTLIDHLPPEAIRDAVNQMISLMSVDTMKFFVRELLARGMHKYAPLVDDVKSLIKVSAESCSSMNDPMLESCVTTLPAKFIETTKEMIESGRTNVSSIMTQHLLSALSKGSIHSEYIHDSAGALIRACEKLGHAALTHGLKAFDDEVHWFSYNSEKHLIAFGSHEGKLSCAQRRDNYFIMGSATVTDNIMIDHVVIDPSGCLIFVYIKAINKISIYEISIPKENESEIKLFLVFDNNVPSVLNFKWIKPRQLLVTPEGKDPKIINVP